MLALSTSLITKIVRVSNGQNTQMFQGKFELFRNIFIIIKYIGIVG